MASENTIATAYIQLVPTLAGVQGSIGEAFGGAQMDKDADEAGKKMGGKFALAAAGAVAAGAAAVGAAAKGLFDVGATFDDVADTIQTTTGKTGAELDTLVGQAKNIGKTLPVEFDKIGPALSGVSQKLNLTGGDLETVTSQFLALGNMGQNIDLDKATGAFNVFGIKGADVSAQLDGLFAISQKTGVGIDQITGAVEKSAPALQGLGYSFQESAAMVGQLEKAGLNSQAILGGMGKSLVSLAKDGEEPQAAFQRITGDIGSLVSQGKDAEALDLAAGLFGTKGATQFLEATKNGSLNVQEMTASLADSQGSILATQKDTSDFAEQWTLAKNNLLTFLEPMGSAVFGAVGSAMAKINEQLFPMLDSLSALGAMMKTGDFTGGIFGLEEDSPVIGGLLAFRDVVLDLSSSVGGVFKQAWETLWPTIKEVGTILGGAILDVFKELWPTVKNLLPTLLELFQAFNPISLLFKAIQPLLPQIAELIANLARSLGGILSQALTALTPIFEKLVGVVQSLLPFVTQLIASLLPPLSRLLEKVAPLITAILDAVLPLISSLLDSLIPVFMSLVDAVLPLVMTAFEFIANTIDNLVTVLGGVIDFITGVFSGDWGKAWDGILQIFSGIWDQVKNIFNTLWTLASEFFTNLLPRIWDILLAAGGWLLDRGSELIGWLVDGIKAGWDLAVAWFQAIPENLWNSLVTIWNQVGEWGWQFIMWIWEGSDGNGGLKGTWDTVIQWFKDIPDVLWAAIRDLWSTVAAWGTRLINWIWTGDENGTGHGGIVGAWDSVVAWFMALPDSLWESIKGAWSAAVEWGGQLIKFIIEGISGGSSYVSAELARVMINAAEDILPGLSAVFDLTGIDINKNVDDYLKTLEHKASGGYFGPIDGTAGGRIGLGTHGTADDVLIRGSRNEFMVNERATARWYPALKWMNDGGLPGFADGGFIGSVGTNVGGHFLADLLPRIGEIFATKIKDMFSTTTLVGGTATKSQDPSSFGWVRASNIVPFNYGGQTIGIAGGTEGLWRALLDALIPSVPGGLLSLGGYENRNIAGTSTPSFHSYGLALDVNAGQNYRGLPGYGRGGFGEIPGELAHALATRFGMEWGGDWGYTDPMHFEIHVSPGQIGAAGALSGLMGVFAQSTGVEQWRALGLRALAMLGQPASLIGAVLSQIDFESSGNPRAINLGDANARRGTPSKGLVQVIDPTFRSFALAGYDQDIYDPLSNLLAGMRWAIASQGGIAAAWGHQSTYDDGGWLMPGIAPVSMMREPEPVLSPHQWSIAEAAIDQVVDQKRRGSYTWNVYPQAHQEPASIAREMDRLMAFSGR